jgi:hypothetical protein
MGSRLQDLEAAALRAEFDARHIQLLQEQVTQANNALAREQACNEKQAEAFMEVARASDNRARDLEAQYANRARDDEALYTAKLSQVQAAHDAVVAASIAELKKQNAQLAASHVWETAAKNTALSKLERDHAALKLETTVLRVEVAAQVSAKNGAIAGMNRQFAELEAAHARTIASKDTTFANLEREFTALRADATAQLAAHARTVAAKDAAFANLERELTTLRADATAHLAEVHAAVTSKLALELHPVRRDRRQFATLHVGPMPFDKFDTAWCATACGRKWKVDIDSVAQTRAHVKWHDHVGHLTLRGAAPLPRRLPCAGTSPQPLPSYCVVIEGYSAPDSRGDQYCNVGFVPSHTSTDGAPVTPVMGRNIHHYGGWWIQVQPSAAIRLHGAVIARGWRTLRPRDAARGAAAKDTSAYATTDYSPPVPAGSAVEFAIDYAAATCRVAFYTPAAVAGGFVEAPYAKIELRFVATAAGDVPDWGDAVPARAVPTAATDSRVHLFPAVSAPYAGAVWRFV